MSRRPRGTPGGGFTDQGNHQGSYNRQQVGWGGQQQSGSYTHEQPWGGAQANYKPAPLNPQLTLYPPLDWATDHSSCHGALYTRLARNISTMVETLTPSAPDVEAKRQVLQLVHESVVEALPEYQRYLKVLPFGSFMAGLATRDSDLDVVITGVTQPYDGRFYSKGERPRVANLLDKVQRALRLNRGLRIQNMFGIRHARIPLIKLTTYLNRQPGRAAGQPYTDAIHVDISMATDSGPVASQHLSQQSRKFPALRPLLLVIKGYLKALDLNEVASGGLSSFGLTYMIIAHLTAEQAAGRPINDLAWLLHGFFITYGREYQPYKHCVDIKHGGVMLRTSSPNATYTNLDRVCCIDPLTGRDITEGAYRSDEVLAAFSRAATYLDGLAKHYSKECPDDLNVLDGLIGIPAVDEDWFDEEGGDDYVQPFEPPAKRMNSTGSRCMPGVPGTQQPQYNNVGYAYPEAQQQPREEGAREVTGTAAAELLGKPIGGLADGSDLGTRQAGWGAEAGGVAVQRAQSSPAAVNASTAAEGVAQQLGKKRSLDVAFGNKGRSSREPRSRADSGKGRHPDRAPH